MGWLTRSLLVTTSLLLGTYEAYGMEDPYEGGKKPKGVHIGKNKATCVFNDSVSYQKGEFKIQSKGQEHFTVPHNPGKFQIQFAGKYDGTPTSMPYEEKVLMRIKKVQDGRVRVRDTTTWPHVINAQLEMRYPSGNYGGSGILVGPHHILTAAHNVYSNDTKEWAQDITVCLGLNGKVAPFGTIKVVKALTFKQWVDERNQAYDMALLILDRSIGSDIGWSGLLSLDDDSLLKEEVHVTGYPGDKGFTKMMTMSHKLKTVEPEQVYYDIDTYGGQSGSGICIDKWGSPYAIGIHTLGEGVLNTGNSGVRLSRHKFDTIIQWISKSLLLPQNKAPEPPSSAFSMLSAIFKLSPPQQNPVAPALVQMKNPPPERPIKMPIPDVARGYKDVYERFLRGRLIYKPYKESDIGKIELRIADLPNPLDGEFDLSECGDTGKYLSINTGYRKGKRPENARKVEIWFAPHFLIKKNLKGSASHFKEIMGSWDPRKAPIGTFFTQGNWDNLTWYDYATNFTWETYNDVKHDLYEIQNYKLESTYITSRVTYFQTDHSVSRFTKAFHIIFELETPQAINP